MGFLDRFVGDMVSRGTGFNARGLVRMVGGKRLLMLGGAALVGGMMAQSRGVRLPGAGRGSDPTGRRNVEPPKSSKQPKAAAVLPPLPPTEAGGGAQSLPPLPAPTNDTSVADRGDGAGAEQTGVEIADPPPELLYAIVRTMVAAALADGEIDPSEKAMIDRHVDESGLARAQIHQIRRDLVVPASPSELARCLPAGESGETLGRFAVLVLRADGELGERERTWLEALGSALGITRSRFAELEREIFPG